MGPEEVFFIFFFIYLFIFFLMVETLTKFCTIYTCTKATIFIQKLSFPGMSFIAIYIPHFFLLW